MAFKYKPQFEGAIMSKRTLTMTDSLYDYMLNVSVRESDVLKALREKTASMGTVAKMQIAPEQGQFMALLVEILQAKNLLEVGTFTGYSALVCAMAMPADGKIVACDINGEWTKVGRPFWEQAGVSDKIDLKLGPALETLDQLLADGHENHFDMMFIDADKKNYDRYYEQGLKLVRPGGLILIDNVLWGGDVVNESAQDENTVAIRQLNQKLSIDDRIHLSMVPIADGLTIARKV